ncbi:MULTISPECIES: SPOR domain-containing protein [Tamlana]|uniref:Translation initiation factor IF-2 n=1 Tax=Pseudotamlana carrageenivorans TaxID=2069432 RepID=A0A2I7SG45_9FLAO|nr:MULTISPECIES: SPOR domain-containing protein [Tamlana]AUS04873.1 translation initiation factor IF-2 [Tamlana carrageenivorans]
MIFDKVKITICAFVCFTLTTTYVSAQEGTVTINQDENISKLIELKKNMNNEDADRYKIQIYNGNRQDAYAAQNEFKSSFSDWNPSIHFEQPNFKIWVGNFRTRLEADRALKRIKQKFSSAFIFKPKK